VDSRSRRPIYIGKTQQAVETRYEGHKSRYFSAQRHPPLYQWMKGEVNRIGGIIIYKLQENIPEEFINDYEKFWISQFSGLLNVTHRRLIPRRDTRLAQYIMREGSF
jgi:hypothetical protein